MAARWRYFLTDPQDAEEGYGSLLRLADGAPLLTAQMAMADGTWALTDRMWRVHFLGSEEEFTEIDRSRAQGVVQSWLTVRLLQQPPDLDAPGPDQEVVDAAQQADDRADAAWSDVRTPPGVEGLEL